MAEIWNKHLISNTMHGESLKSEKYFHLHKTLQVPITVKIARMQGWFSNVWKEYKNNFGFPS